MSTGTAAPKQLTAKQEQFCLEYLIDFNATQAAIRAGYSKKTSYSIGQRMLKNVEMMERLAILKDERAKRATKSADDVIKELECIGFSRLRDVMHWNESGVAFARSSDELDDDAMAAIESVEVTEIAGKGEDSNATLKTKVKLHPKIPALKELEKHHGICTDKVDISGAVDVTVNVVKYGKGK